MTYHYSCPTESWRLRTLGEMACRSLRRVSASCEWWCQTTVCVQVMDAIAAQWVGGSEWDGR